jgi:hypothetical protein
MVDSEISNQHSPISNFKEPLSVLSKLDSACGHKALSARSIFSLSLRDKLSRRFRGGTKFFRDAKKL